jgi:hypothetical protein
MNITQEMNEQELSQIMALKDKANLFDRMIKIFRTSTNRSQMISLMHDVNDDAVKLGF